MKQLSSKQRSRSVTHLYSSDDAIVIKGARVHNLKEIDVTLPRESLIVLTGPSGSGKSSLAFDTIYAEGQRRYVESLSTYARQFIEQLEKPDVDSIEGLSPTISIAQKTTSYNPRSTVGTVTEVYDYLRLLYARIGIPFCYLCGERIQAQTPRRILDQILNHPAGSKLAILAPIVRGRKGEYQKELYQLSQRGFVRVRIDGVLYDLSEEIKLDRNKKHDIEVYIDRIVIKAGTSEALTSRVSESVELALKMGDGLLLLENFTTKKLTLFSEKFACIRCGISYPKPEPRTFSFNSPLGACPRCDGLGVEPGSDTLEDTGEGEDELSSLKESKKCLSCEGQRLRRESLHYKVEGRNIAEVTQLSIAEAISAFQDLHLTEREELIANRILREINERLGFLEKVGVGYLSLSRSAKTLSGGEAQRIRLATQIGSSLVDVIYVLDEPSIGLHPRDHHRLLETLERLRDLGNTVVVVEHDRETIERADYIVDLGPGAGVRGGEVTANGSLSEILRNKKSLTGRYLSGALKIKIPERRRNPKTDHCIRLVGAYQNNLKDVSVDFPLGVFTCVTGVSGSGKSTLVMDTLYRLLVKSIYKVETGPVLLKEFHGLKHVDKVVDINQKPIGRTPRSNPATYAGLFSLIRDLFASLPEAQIRGFKPGRFSFNVKGGRCEACEGGGLKKIEMHFLPNVYVKCDVCHGSRYNRETLEVRFKGKNIAQVLGMTAAEALEFFDAVPSLKARLKVLNDVGLGYIHLGQSATTLSGGEAQRIKLAKELSKRGTGKTVYILDEPTTGLHFDDISKLLTILQRLVDQGNTVIVIEHNTDFIRAADYIIDLGPEGGKAGGQVIAKGTPEEIAKNPQSHTGRYLS